MGKKSQLETYEVEKIMQMRKDRTGRTVYKIKWLGWGMKDCTWEPMGHLLAVKDMVTQFLTNRKVERQIEREKKKEREKENKVYKKRGPPFKKDRDNGAIKIRRRKFQTQKIILFKRDRQGKKQENSLIPGNLKRKRGRPFKLLSQKTDDNKEIPEKNKTTPSIPRKIKSKFIKPKSDSLQQLRYNQLCLQAEEKTNIQENDQNLIKQDLETIIVNCLHMDKIRLTHEQGKIFYHISYFNEKTKAEDKVLMQAKQLIRINPIFIHKFYQGHLVL